MARNRIVGLGVGALVVSALALSGCTAAKQAAPGQATTAAAQTGAPSTPPSAQPAAPAVLAIKPANNAAGVNPAQPITVAASEGTLTAVKLTAAGGGSIAGSFAKNKLSWATATPLGYGASYTITATAINADGKPTSKTATFRTLVPGNKTLPEIRLNNGQVYGVGQPIPIHFDEPITDKKAAEQSLIVSTSPKVAGSWHWFNDKDVDWRPQSYWRPGTKITVTAKVMGVQVGPGLYGQQNVSSHITIGQSKVAKADFNTHELMVYFGGKLVRRIPTSMGQGGGLTTKSGNYISLWTNSGPHVVLDKSTSVHMTSASFGLPANDPSGMGYDVTLPYGVRISDGGEYVHVNEGTVGDQGVRNVSHGCLNVNMANGLWFYNNFNPGDVVEITGTPQKLQPQDGYGDWTLSWKAWVAGSALK